MERHREGLFAGLADSQTTQYLLREDGTYAATPNGIATEDGGELAVVMVNTSCESVPGILELEGLREFFKFLFNSQCQLFIRQLHNKLEFCLRVLFSPAGCAWACFGV